MMTNENDMSSIRLRINQVKQMKNSLDFQKLEGFKKQRLLYIINNEIKEERGPLIARQYSSKNSDINEDVEMLLKEMMGRHDTEENKFFGEVNMDEYDSLRNLRLKRMRDSIESPMFGSKRDTFQSQRNLIRGLTVTSKDELEQANTKKNYGGIFQKQKRHFSFAESENSSFPSSSLGYFSCFLLIIQLLA